MGTFDFPHRPEAAGSLEDTGPLIEVEITVPIDLQEYLREHGITPCSTRHGYALIDTGAFKSAIERTVFDELEIPVVGFPPTSTPHGEGISESFNAAASFPSISLYNVPLDLVLGAHVRTPTRDGKEIIMLLGRDILRHMVMVYDGPRSHVTLHR